MSALTVVDVTIMAVIAISSLISLFRGFVKEAISLASWLIAFWVAYTFSAKLAVLLPEFINPPSLRLGLSIVVLFLLTLMVGGVANLLIGQLISRSGLNGTDRLLGVVFGFSRGVLIVAVLVWFARLTALPQYPWWEKAVLIGYFEDIARWLEQHLPSDVAKYFAYSRTTEG